MTDPKNKPEHDVVASAADEPVTINDADLEETDGGFSFSTFTATTTYIPGGDQFVNTNINTSTEVNVESPTDTSANTFLLRRRPGRIGNF